MSNKIAKTKISQLKSMLSPIKIWLISFFQWDMD